MRQFEKIMKFVRLPWKEKGHLMEALYLSGIIRFAILFFPFRKVASIMGKQMTESPPQASMEAYKKALTVRRAVEKVSRFTPWESKCLVQALSALIMLKRRKVLGTLYLGITKDGSDKLLAHAWLRCGEMTVTGGREQGMFKAVAYFSSQPRGKVQKRKDADGDGSAC